MQFGPQSAGRLSPLQNCSGLISSYCDSSGAGGDRYEISSISEMTWSPVGATEIEQIDTISFHSNMMYYIFGVERVWPYPRIDCMCLAGTVLRRDTSRNGTARKSLHLVCRAAHRDRLVLHSSIGSRRSRRLAAGCIGRPMDSWPNELIYGFWCVWRARRRIWEWTRIMM